MVYLELGHNRLHTHILQFINHSLRTFERYVIGGTESVINQLTEISDSESVLALLALFAFVLKSALQKHLPLLLIRKLHILAQGNGCTSLDETAPPL
jgi:hypothetical protein